MIFLFPGQGAQYVGMGKELAEEFAIARQTFEEANEALGFDLQKLCFEGDIEELTKTANTQPAILTHSVAAFRVWMEELGLSPKYLAGHSLGEYSALVSSGALKFADAVKLVHKRGQFMQEAVPVGIGSMMAVLKLDQIIVDKVCKEISTPEEIVVAANYNSEGQIVISGHARAVERAGEKLKEKGATVKALKVSAPFHSPLMQPAAEKMREELQKIEFGQMKWPVISNVNALPYQSTENLIDNLVEQIVKPVRWYESMAYLNNHRMTKAVEMGPGVVLKNLLKRSSLEMEVYSLDKPKHLNTLVEQFVVKRDLTKVISKSLAVAVCTKNHNADNDAYQKGVVEPYKKTELLLNKLEGEGKEATIEQAKEALEMLRSVFTTKMTPVEEQIERFTQIFDVSGTQKDFVDFEMPVLI